MTNLTDVHVPRSIQEALDQPQWKDAVFEEMRALEKNGTWTISDLPKEKILLDANGLSLLNTMQMEV